MSEATRILEAIEAGDPQAAAALMPLVYNELRRLAAEQLAAERPGQTLTPTALVHEAYLRLVGPEGENRGWNSRAHFYATAAQAMRRILVDAARRRRAQKRGGNAQRVDADIDTLESPSRRPDLIQLD